MERINQWLTLMGNLGIIAGIVFLGYEIRQTTVVMEASSRQEFAAQDLAYFATSLDATVIAAAMNKLEMKEALSDLELSQLVQRQHLNFRIFENALYQHRKGTLEKAEWDRYSNIISVVICNHAPAQKMWARYSRIFVPEFVEIVEQHAAICPR